ncbi:PKHD-type hydroxylase TPA1 [Verticillium alfalfae VaMs.102]|uniref:uS12 prolyl 3,4-dihydroxylase n=1 Tax=Verticillium alfalfae (strain VaMs.102 / ATCC MYA-4576 / FGSC 10136) TaxID=526221 RepID=C9SJF7_VERA1|nr:PKHD-type hydroxylase TPA1 [Verticillium alfalfae VaMs.102]EEY18319.1 PKHD-type hydroxylase TPA1 [Verticillium alfalfae VaMs.102]
MKRKADAQADKKASKKKRSKSVLSAADAKSRFRDGLFDQEVLQAYTDEYATSSPYKHAVIHKLADDKLLRSVRDEIRENVSFTPKETDIYKIHQSGDLANLDGLDNDALAKLPSLLALRDAMYSETFRHYVSHITGCGPLSGRKTDMAINVYTPGCYLLCHDDVIGSRKVSYILYLTDPDVPWKPEWGGALRLYPVDEKEGAGGEVAKTPAPEFAKVIPPAWNQLSFFAVQPGESFHDVEEVYHAASPAELARQGGRVRMAISATPPPGSSPNPRTSTATSTSSPPTCAPPATSRPSRSSLDVLLPSRQFRQWLQTATGCVVEGHDLLARRFRRGQDYTLATGYAGKPRLEMNLGFTPTVGWGDDEGGDSDDDDEEDEEEEEEQRSKKGKGKAKAKDSKKEKQQQQQQQQQQQEEQEAPEVGGHEVYMAGDDEEDDDDADEQAKKDKNDAAVYKSSGDEDNILFFQAAAWNKMTLVLRDSGALKFVKYVSQSAPGDRWDVSANFDVEEQDLPPGAEGDGGAAGDDDDEEEEFQGFSDRDESESD